MKPNILLVAHESMINGASLSLLNLIDTLKDKCRFTVVVPYNYGTFLDEINKRNLRVFYVPFKRWIQPKDDSFKILKKEWKKDNLKNQIMAKELAGILKNERIDIIHSNTSVVDFGYRLSKLLKVPHIWHVREFGEDDFSMYPLCSYRTYYRKMCDRNNTLVCVSKAVSEKYKRKISKKRLRVIYNGIDAKNINNHKTFTKTKKEPLILLQSGMIHPAKGQDLTIKAVEELHKEGYKNIELWLAGSGKIEDLGIGRKNKKWLKVLGQVSNLPEIRKKVNVEIVSSKKEAFGRVTIEAMMGQIPVIGSASGGTKELIQDNQNGLLFEPNNVEDLKEKIKYLADNRKEIKRLGENAYRKTKQYFLIERTAKEVYALYQELIKK